MDLRDIIDAVDEEPKKEQTPLSPKYDENTDAHVLDRIRPVVGVLLFARVVFLAAAILFTLILSVALLMYLGNR